MNESTRTLSFVGVAVALVAVAYGTHIATRPPSLSEFSDVGEEFYADFKEPRDATGLRVAAYNEDAARVDVFNVDVKDGRWRIPSHHNYPADGEERLAKTATSIIGLTRDALASSSADDHKRYGVLDPLDESITGTEGRGDRITLTQGNNVLADYIVGTKIEDGPENTFHIRRPDEKHTYRVTLNLDISTKFADWIEPDLLDFRRGDIRELVIDQYSIDEAQGVVVPGEQSELTRAAQDDPWKLKGIDEATEQVNTSTVNQMITALEELSIVGVRPKPAGLSASLKGEAGAAVNILDQQDLEQKGFFIDSRGMLVSNEGDVRLGTSDGVMYVLRFGEVFTGSDVEIEVGNSSTDSDAAENPNEEKSVDEEQVENDSLKKNRYLFITTQFDETYIEPLGEKPVKPEPPADVDEKPAEEKKTDEDKPDATEPDAAADTTEKPDAGEKTKPDPKAEYEQALADYETKLEDWEQREQEHTEKIEAGQKRVQELNQRFADWYYVISAESFDEIRVSRDELIEKQEPETTEGAGIDLPTGSPAPPVLQPASEAAPSAEPATESPSDTPKPADDSTTGKELPVPETKASTEANTPAADAPTTESPAKEQPETETPNNSDAPPKE